MLEKYLQMFANLRTDRGRDRYPAITYHRAPHKPFLLLSVMDLIAQGRITENRIEPSYAAPRQGIRYCFLTTEATKTLMAGTHSHVCPLRFRRCS